MSQSTQQTYQEQPAPIPPFAWAMAAKGTQWSGASEWITATPMAESIS